MSDHDYQTALRRAVREIDDVARWRPLLELARRVGRLEEAARALLEALPDGLARAPLELEMLRTLAAAEVSLGRPWWCCPTIFTNVTTHTGDRRYGVDLLDEGVQILSGPGLLGQRLLPWPPGRGHARSTQMHAGDREPWFWLLAAGPEGSEEDDLLALDPDTPAWAVVQKVPAKQALLRVDYETREVELRPSLDREAPAIRRPFEVRPGVAPPEPRTKEASPDWASGLEDELGTAPLAAEAMAFGPRGDALVVERGWRTPWVLERSTGVPRKISSSIGYRVRIPLGVRARWRTWTAAQAEEGINGLALVPRGESGLPLLQPLPTSVREQTALVDPTGDWLYFVEPGGRLPAPGGRLRARALAGGEDWQRRLVGFVGQLLAGAGGVATLGLPEGGVTVYDAATGEDRWRGILPPAARPGHEGGLARAGLLGRHADGAWLLRSRDSLVWLEPDGTSTLVEGLEPEGLPAPRALAVAPDGRFLARWGEGGRLEVLAPRTGARRSEDARRPPLGDTPALPHGPLAIDPSSRLLAYLEGDLIRLVRLAELESALEAPQGENASPS